MGFRAGCRAPRTPVAYPVRRGIRGLEHPTASQLHSHPYHGTMSIIEKGAQAPDFTLESHADEKVSLSGLRGKNVLLVFYPLDFTPT